MKPTNFTLPFAVLTAAATASAGQAQQAAEAPIVAAEAQDSTPLTAEFGNTLVTLYGYLKADFIRDRDYDLGDTTKGLRDIGLLDGPAAGKSDRQYLKESRIGIDVERGDLFARFEGDFFSDNSSLRLRHAYVSWNGLMVGQNWMYFMSVDNLGPTVDFQGPAGLPFARVPQIRYTWENATGLSIGGAIEEDPLNTDDFFLTVVGKKEYDWGFLRAAGMRRDAKLGTTQIDGWGVNLSSIAKPWDGGALKFNYVNGRGISDLLAFGLSGPAIYDGDEVPVQAFTVGVSHKFANRITLAATYGQTELERAVDTNTKKLNTTHLSAFYDLNENVSFMLEYFTGDREQGDGASFNADRIQFATKITF